MLIVPSHLLFCYRLNAICKNVLTLIRRIKLVVPLPSAGLPVTFNKFRYFQPDYSFPQVTVNVLGAIGK